MKKISIIIISIILLGVTGCKNYKSEIDEPQIPNLQIKSNDTDITVEKGSYEWNIDNVYIIADAASPLQIGEKLEGNKISSLDKLELKFTVEPKDINIVLWEDDDNQINLNKSNITLPKEQGTYIYEIIGYWEKGKVSYTTKIIIDN
ncbi:MAG: hypothetical protein ACRDD7_04090 [Peptostreptococcaceae bacterium]